MINRKYMDIYIVNIVRKEFEKIVKVAYDMFLNDLEDELAYIAAVEYSCSVLNGLIGKWNYKVKEDGFVEITYEFESGDECGEEMG